MGHSIQFLQWVRLQMDARNAARLYVGNLYYVDPYQRRGGNQDEQGDDGVIIIAPPDSVPGETPLEPPWQPDVQYPPDWMIPSIGDIFRQGGHSP